MEDARRLDLLSMSNDQLRDEYARLKMLKRIQQETAGVKLNDVITDRMLEVEIEIAYRIAEDGLV